MDFYIAQLIDGLVNGGLYGLLGLAMMLIYRSSRLLNFAIGEIATVVSFVALITWNRFGGLYVLPITIAFAFIFGVFLQSCIVGFVKQHGEKATIVTVAIHAIINSFVGWEFGHEPLAFPSVFPAEGVNIAGAYISYQNFFVLGATFAVVLILYIFMRYSLLGIAFQAMAEDPLAARLIGIRVGVLVAVSWGIGSVVAGVSGVLVAQSISLNPNTMATALLYGFAAAVIGGLQSSFGAVVGGMIVGVVENFAGSASWIGSGLKASAVFVVLLVFLLLRPTGLFGRDEARKI